VNGRVLVVDDDVELCRLLEADLERRGFEVAWDTSADEALERIAREEFDVVLTDLRLPNTDGLEFCRRVLERREDLPVVMMTAFGNLDSAIAAIQAGAYDFVTKPLDSDVLVLSLRKAVERRSLQRKIRLLRGQLDHAHDADGLLGESAPMRELHSQLGRVAPSDASVLILGESGTGKELVARALHARSDRKDGPFVPVNCAALPEPLLESELFGHRQGAFTDARTERKGLILQADGGTLFLDEIGDLPLAIQPKLLRALEERRVRPVGGDAEKPFDARIVAATNRDLESAVEDQDFREDLFYRINVIQLYVPPLRARGTDTLLLARHFVEDFAARAGKGVTDIAGTVAEKLLDYPWPGNVRELANAMQRAVALTRYDTISVEDLPARIRDHQGSGPIVVGNDPADLVPLEELERRYILRVLETLGGNRSQAARVLKLDRKTLYRKLRRYGQDGA
jgi:two-component system response regulator HydG